VTKYVKACLNCAYYKYTMGKRPIQLNNIDKASIPFHTVHLDHVGSFKTNQKYNKFLLVMIDTFTEFVIIEPVKSQKASQVIRFLILLFTYLEFLGL